MDRLIGKFKDMLTLMESANDTEFEVYHELFNDYTYGTGSITFSQMEELRLKLHAYGLL